MNLTFKEFLEKYEKELQGIENSLANDILEELKEGIDIDQKNKVVTFNPNHEDNADTSVEYNPNWQSVMGLDVVSIFTRKKSDLGDANPLIHALKGNNGWKIDNESVLSLFKNFIKISKKIKPQYDTIISIKSSSSLNNDFLYRLNKIIKAPNQIRDVFNKLPASEILVQGGVHSSISDKDFKTIQDRISKMIKKDDYFTYKEIPPRLRKYIDSSSVIFGDDVLKYSDMINGKDILILDDTIASGKTISDNVQAIQDTFSPKSIQVITLFSAL